MQHNTQLHCHHRHHHNVIIIIIIIIITATVILCHFMSNKCSNTWLIHAALRTKLKLEVCAITDGLKRLQQDTQTFHVL